MKKATRPSVPEVAAAVQWPVNVGTAARLAGLSAKMLRYYESLGLLPGIARSEGGYRQYDEAQVQTLRFIQRSRAVGFSLEDIAELLALRQNPHRSSAQVRQLALRHAQALDQRIADMHAMRIQLQQLIDACAGDAHPDCAILDTLGGEHPHPVEGVLQNL